VIETAHHIFIFESDEQVDAGMKGGEGRKEWWTLYSCIMHQERQDSP